MDGIHDLGGMHGFGAIPIEDEDYVFKHQWQRRSFGLAQALAGPARYCADMHRHKIECIPPVDYLEMDYFEKWAVATSELLVDMGLANRRELQTGTKEFDVDLINHPPIGPNDLVRAMRDGVQLKFPDDTCIARFAIGDQVRVRSDAPPHHSRVPRYVRNRVGEIVGIHGVFQFADSVAQNAGPSPQHCYAVAFTAACLWGNDAEAPTDMIQLDLAEAYLDSA